MSVRSLLMRGRGAMLEFMPEPGAEGLAEQIAAFANGSGGAVVLGMDEDGRVYGDPSEDLEPVFLRALDLCSPPFSSTELPEWQTVETNDGRIVVLTVKPTPRQTRLVNGLIYVRSGSLNVRLRPEEVVSAPGRDIEEGYESRVIAGATQDDLDEEIIEEYRRNRLQRGPQGEALTQVDLLRDAGAIDPAGRPTAAGLLLFGKHPEYFMPQVGVLLVRFPGTSIREAAMRSQRYARRVEITGPAPRLIERTWAALFAEIAHVPYMAGLQRRERYEYPVEAVRESVVNAVCHRDYGITGQRIEIRLFDDRLEIISPGGLPGHITLDNILDEHYSRNPRLVRGLYCWGYIEELGQGVDIIYEAMRREHHPEPAFRDTTRSFTVTLRNAIDDLGAEYEGVLNDRQILVMRYLAEHERITNRQYQRFCSDVSSETLRLDLRDMVEKGLLLKVGNKRGTFYVLK